MEHMSLIRSWRYTSTNFFCCLYRFYGTLRPDNMFLFCINICENMRCTNIYIYVHILCLNKALVNHRNLKGPF